MFIVGRPRVLAVFAGHIVLWLLYGEIGPKRMCFVPVVILSILKLFRKLRKLE